VAKSQRRLFFLTILQTRTVKLGLNEFFRHVAGAFKNQSIDLIRIASLSISLTPSFTRGGITDVWQDPLAALIQVWIPLLETGSLGSPPSKE